MQDAALRFGYDRLRPEQAEAVAAIVDGRDVVAILPTGAGKSAIYQVAGALIDGPTVVVSPLVALQRDQVRAIAEHGNERRGDAERLGRRRGARAAAPRARGRRPRVPAARPRAAGPVRNAGAATGGGTLPGGGGRGPLHQRVGPRLPPRLPAARRNGRAARTPARARVDGHRRTSRARQICRRLGLDDPLVLVRGFDRPTIHLAVETIADAGARDQAVIEAVCEADGRASSTARRAPRPRQWRMPSSSAACRPTPTTPAARSGSGMRCTTPSWSVTRSWWPRSRSAWASTSRTCDSSSTRSRAPRWTRTGRRSGAPHATGSRRAPCCTCARPSSAGSGSGAASRGWTRTRSSACSGRSKR